jgi:hypothetical protein
MTSPKGKEADGTGESVLRIADELVRQLDVTRRLVVIMVVAVIVGIPVSWHVTPYLLGTPYNFAAAGIVTVFIAGAFVVVGARQFLVLSRWTKRYKAYKELQEKIDAELDFEGAPSTEAAHKPD